MKRKIYCGRKSAASALLAVMLAICSFFHDSAFAGEITYTLDLSDLEIKMDTVIAPDGNQYVRFSAPGCDYFGEPGEPMIPYKVFNFLVPYDSKDYEVLDKNESLSSGFDVTIPILNVAPIVSMNEVMEEVFYHSTRPELFPEHGSAKFVRAFVLNGRDKIITVVVPTITKTDSEFKCISKVDIEISFKEDIFSQNENVASDLPYHHTDYDISKIVVNPPTSIKKEGVSYAYVNNSALRYYIITPKEFEASLEPLVGWKKQKGYTVVVKTVEDILADDNFKIGAKPECIDKEASVRCWLKSEYNKYANTDDFQLLMVGNSETSTPIRKFRLSEDFFHNREFSDDYNGDYYIPSDAYFSTLDSDFNLIKEHSGYHSILLNGLEYKPNLAIGRILAKSQDNISNYFRKLLIYELDPGLGNSDYLNNGLLSVQHSFLNCKSIFDGIKSLDNIIVFKDTIGGVHFHLNRPTGMEVLNDMKKCGLYSLQGHGSPYSIAVSGKTYGETGDDYRNYRYIQAKDSYSYTNNDAILPGMEDLNGLDNLDNANAPSILYTMSCDTMPFDIYSDRNEYNMAESFTVAGKYGGPAYIGNTRYGWITTSSYPENHFGGELINNNTIGKSLNLSGLNAILGNSEFSNYVKFTRNIVGDPDIKVWLHEPYLSNVRIKLSGSILYCMQSDLIGSKLVISDGANNQYTNIMDNKEASFSIGLPTIGFNQNLPFVATVLKDGYLPLTKFQSSGELIKYKSLDFYLNSPDLSEGISGKNLLNIGIGGNLNIFGTRGLATDSTLHVANGGKVHLNSYKKVSLKGDVVNEGGELNITAPSVVLQSGFKIEKGGKLTIEIDN